MSDVSIPLSQLMRGTSHVDMLCISELCTCMLVTQSCLPLYNPMDCSSPGSSVHGILQARILEWVVVPFSRGSSSPRNRTQVFRIAGRFFTIWAIREALLLKPLEKDIKAKEIQTVLSSTVFICRFVFIFLKHNTQILQTFEE